MAAILEVGSVQPTEQQKLSFRNTFDVYGKTGYILSNFANDAAAASGGIQIGGLYRNGSVVQVRVT